MGNVRQSVWTDQCAQASMLAGPQRQAARAQPSNKWPNAARQRTQRRAVQRVGERR